MFKRRIHKSNILKLAKELGRMRTPENRTDIDIIEFTVLKAIDRRAAAKKAFFQAKLARRLANTKIAGRLPQIEDKLNAYAQQKSAVFRRSVKVASRVHRRGLAQLKKLPGQEF